MTGLLRLQDAWQVVSRPFPEIINVLVDVGGAVRGGKEAIVGGHDDGIVLGRMCEEPGWEKAAVEARAADQESAVEVDDERVRVGRTGFGDED